MSGRQGPPGDTTSKAWWTPTDEARNTFSLEGQIILHNLEILAKEFRDVKNLITAQSKQKGYRNQVRSQAQRASRDESTVDLTEEATEEPTSQEVQLDDTRTKQQATKDETQRLLSEFGHMLLDGLQQFLAVSRAHRPYVSKTARAPAMADAFKKHLLASPVFHDVSDDGPDMEAVDPAAQIMQHLGTLSTDELTDFYIGVSKLHVPAGTSSASGSAQKRGAEEDDTEQDREMRRRTR